jgi:hypothetical protein
MATIKWLCDACRTQYNTEQEAARCERELKGIKLPVTVKLGDKVYLRQAINPSIPAIVKRVKLGPYPKGLRGLHSVYLELTELVSLQFYDELHGDYESAESEVCLEDVATVPPVC